jgi:hypothetical protein
MLTVWFSVKTTLNIPVYANGESDSGRNRNNLADSDVSHIIYFVISKEKLSIYFGLKFVRLFEARARECDFRCEGLSDQPYIKTIKRADSIGQKNNKDIFLCRSNSKLSLPLLLHILQGGHHPKAG